MKPLGPNTMIQNRYLVVHLIGKGGMGEVYLAVDQRLGSAVALKRTFFNEDKALGNAFEREARILARLRHPVLPKVIDHFMENNDQFLVMEHISGDDLAKRLESANKPFPLSWVMFWADQMLDALNYLHSHEPPIIHRDIKPQNLKLTDDNHIVLLDFGLSKDFDTNSIGHELNSASVVGYSPHFASMEQVRGTGTDPRSDIYSLSATLYQLMTNAVPSDALTRADARLGGTTDPIVPISDINPEVSKAISDVIIKGLGVRQEERFTTAVEMQKALRRAFNRGEADLDAETMMMTGDVPPTALAQPASRSEASEMVTRTRGGMDAVQTGSGLSTNAPVVQDEMKQSEVKTEVFSGAADLETIETEAEQEQQEQEQGQVTAQEPVQPKEQEPQPVIARAAAAGVPATAAPQAPALPAPAQGSSAKGKKSSSKTGLVIGGLFGLLVFAGVVGGGGWYVYSNYYASANTPALLPPKVEPSPSPALTVLSDDQNTNVNSTTNQMSDSNSAGGNSDQTTATSPDGPTGARPTPQVSTRSTPTRTAPTTPAKPTPKPKPRDDRTVILQ